MTRFATTFLTSVLLLFAGAGCADGHSRTNDVVFSPPTGAAEAEPRSAARNDRNSPPKRDVPYVPTPHRTVAEMLKMAKVSQNDLVYDLGSGDGRIVIAAARDHGARGVGVDIDPERIAESNENARGAGVTDRVQFIQGDLFEVDLRPATAVTLYLLPSVNLKLRPKLIEELRPGTPVVSHDFDMGDWEPDDTRSVGSDRVYLWIIPARVDGTWRWTDSGGEHVLSLDQHFQTVTGQLRSGGVARRLTGGRLTGDHISLVVEDEIDGRRVTRRFEGKVRGQTIDGTVQADGGSRQRWMARHER